MTETRTSISGQLDALEDSLLQAGRTPQEVRAARKRALQEHIDRGGDPETPGEANLSRAKSMFRQPSDEELVDFFGRRPDVLHALLGEVYIVDHYDQKKQRGEGRDGRRTMPRNANLDDLWNLITPRYSMQPFGVAVKELIGERSLRQFAAKVPMDHRELSRMMRGQASISAYHLERIAAAGGVAAAFFMEYRMGYIAEVMQQVFTVRPNLSIGVYRKMRRIGEDQARNRAANGR